MNVSGDRKSVLVVDDEPMNIAILVEILKSAGYQPLVARDGERALKIARNARPDLVLLDVIMPDMDGYQVCSLLKAEAGTREIPVVFVTGMSEDSDRSKGMGLGAAGYLIKPVEADAVTALLGKVIG